jgi:tetratricopeptide (TPR) repeat protein
LSFFRKIFGTEPPLVKVRRAVQDGCWADALSIGEQIDNAVLPSDEREELENLLTSAGDSLAELNLSEGEACLRGGDLARAMEHFALAAEKARNVNLAQRAAAALVADFSAGPAETAKSDPGCCPTGCTPPTTPESVEDSPLDPQTRFDLILASYPPTLAERYEGMGDLFRQAFLLAHDGRAEEALSLFERIASADRNDLYHFERGALLARIGEKDSACRHLEEALVLNPDNLPALELLIGFLLTHGHHAEAEKRLTEAISRQMGLPFCHGRLALLLARRGDTDGALRHGFAAVSLAGCDLETIQLTASLLENAGRLAEAESLLERLSGGGCAGGLNVPLAEFHLRHGGSLDKALEAFKGAARSEPDNPRWHLRIAQTYFRKGWKKEGFALLEKILADPRVPADLREEGMAELHRTGKTVL